MANSCPFCLENRKVRIILQTENAYLIAPIGVNGECMTGCYLIIPKQHVESALDMPDNWHAEVKELVRMTPEYIQGKRAFNISQNQGKDAGQRVNHCHTWLIFREGENDKKSYQLGLKALIDLAN